MALERRIEPRGRVFRVNLLSALELQPSFTIQARRRKRLAQVAVQQRPVRLQCRRNLEIGTTGLSLSPPQSSLPARNAPAHPRARRQAPAAPHPPGPRPTRHPLGTAALPPNLDDNSSDTAPKHPIGLPRDKLRVNLRPMPPRLCSIRD